MILVNCYFETYIQFAKSDISDLKRMTEEGDVIWANTRIKAIGRIVVGTANKSKSNFPKSFMRKPNKLRKNVFSIHKEGHYQNDNCPFFSLFVLLGNFQ